MNSHSELTPDTGNAFIDTLDGASHFHLLENNSKVFISKNEVIYNNCSTIDYVYFPKDMIISLTCSLSSGFTAEFIQIGCDGIVGISALMGDRVTQNSAVAQTSGYAYRVATEIVQQAFDSSPSFRHATLRYMQALMQESAQKVVCSRQHAVIQQLTRTLLMTCDRLRSDRLSLTHEQLALAIGCRREAVSVAAAKIQEAGLIHYAYGQISIVDRAGLEALCCECYEGIRQAFSDSRQPKQNLKSFTISAGTGSMQEDMDTILKKIAQMSQDIEILKKNHVDLNSAYVKTLKSLSEMTGHASEAAKKAAQAAENAASSSKLCAETAREAASIPIIELAEAAANAAKLAAQAAVDAAAAAAAAAASAALAVASHAEDASVEAAAIAADSTRVATAAAADAVAMSNLAATFARSAQDTKSKPD